MNLGGDIHYRLLPLGVAYAATGVLLAVAMIWDPAATAPALTLWLTLAGVQLVWPRLALHALDVKLLPPLRPARAGQRVVLAVEVTNRSRWLTPGPLQFQPAVLGRVTALAPCALEEPPPPGQTRVVRVDFGSVGRGRRYASGEALESSRPFGLVAASRRLPEQTVPLTVWCARLTAEELAPAEGRGESRPALAVERRRSRSLGTERSHLRSYRPGDPARSIHWRVSARAGELVVVEPVQTRLARCWLSVDTLSGRWANSAQFERMLQLASTLAEDYYREGRLKGVMVNRHSRHVSDQHALGVVLETFAILRQGSADRLSRRHLTRAAPGQVGRRDDTVLEIIEGEGRRVRLVDTRGRTVLEI